VIPRRRENLFEPGTKTTPSAERVLFLGVGYCFYSGIRTMTEQIPITATGYEKIKLELKHLKSVERPAVITEIAEARALGDLSENAEYHSAREKQGFIEGRIQELEDKLSRVMVIELKETDLNKVVFGAFVTLSESTDDGKTERKTYQIVGDLEADIKANKISLSSPLAKALINKKIGDIVSVSLPKGDRDYEIESVTAASKPLK
jgi:transcription elongation factor GreA